MEKDFEATIFTPSNSIDWRLTSSRLVVGGFVLTLTFLLIAHIYEIDTYVFEAFFIGVIMIVIGAIWGSTEKETPNGRIYGSLVITEEAISINQTSYEWRQVSKFSFNLLHIKNEYLHTTGYRWYGGPAYSAGVDSYIEFTHNSEQFEVFFRVDTSGHYVDISNAIKKLHFKGIIQLQTTYNGLQLSYEEIQELKKQKTLWVSEKSS